MDILQKKGFYDIDKEVMKIMKLLKYKKYPINFKGSASLKSQLYLSDYDFYTTITRKDKSLRAFREFKKIIKNVITKSTTYFIKGIQFVDEENKSKWYVGDMFKYDDFKQLYDKAKFFKIDFVSYIENRFVSLDCIYYFDKEEVSTEDTIKTLNDDIKDYTKEGRYYKVLKRKFRIFEELGEKNKLVELTEFFNSKYGEMYQKLNSLEAMKSLLDFDYYKDNNFILKKIVIALKDLKINPDINEIEHNIEKISKEINNEAKKINKKI